MISGVKNVTFCNGCYRGNMASFELNKQEFDAIDMEGNKIFGKTAKISDLCIFY